MPPVLGGIDKGTEYLVLYSPFETAIARDVGQSDLFGNLSRRRVVPRCSRNRLHTRNRLNGRRGGPDVGGRSLRPLRPIILCNATCQMALSSALDLRCRFAQLIAILPRADSAEPAEDATEVAVVTKANRLAHLID